MIDIKEFSVFIQNVLNNVESASGYPDCSFPMGKVDMPIEFSVRTPSAPFFDSTINATKGSFVIPVMLEERGDGSFEAYPDIGMYEETYGLTIVFPVSEYEDMIAIYFFLAMQVVGKIKLIGEKSGYACFNLGVPTNGQMQYLEAREYSQFCADVSKVFGNGINISREWATMSFDVSVSSINGLGKADGFIYGNQVRHVLTMKYDVEGTLSETLVPIQPSTSEECNLSTQQGVSSKYAKSLVNGTAKGETNTVFVKANLFWKTLMKHYANGTLKEATVTLDVGVYLMDGTLFEKLSSTGEMVMSSSSFNPEIGKTLTFTYALTPKATLGEIT